MNLISIDSLNDTQIQRLLTRGETWFKSNRSHSRGESKDLQNKLVFNLFYENSTRTAMSFAAAAHRLGAAPVFLPVEQSSIIVTEWPSRSNRSVRCDPINPAPPVMRIWLIVLVR